MALEQTEASNWSGLPTVVTSEAAVTSDRGDGQSAGEGSLEHRFYSDQAQRLTALQLAALLLAALLLTALLLTALLLTALLLSALL